MASAHDFFISGDHENARRLVGQALESEGYTVTVEPAGNFAAARGKVASTVLFGGLAGKNFHISFTVDFMIDQQGLLVARLNRNMTGGALKGGAIGAAKTNTAFEQAANTIAAALHSAGVLAGSVPQG